MERKEFRHHYRKQIASSLFQCKYSALRYFCSTFAKDILPLCNVNYVTVKERKNEIKGLCEENKKECPIIVSDRWGISEGGRERYFIL